MHKHEHVCVCIRLYMLLSLCLCACHFVWIHVRKTFVYECVCMQGRMYVFFFKFGAQGYSFHCLHMRIPSTCSGRRWACRACKATESEQSAAANRGRRYQSHPGLWCCRCHFGALNAREESPLIAHLILPLHTNSLTWTLIRPRLLDTQIDRNNLGLMRTD